jgi:hypothetical protein
LRFDRSRLVELWQIKDKRGLRSRVRQSIVFVATRSGQKKDPKRIKKEPESIRHQKVPERVSERYNGDFSEKHRGIFSKRLVSTKVILGGPKPDNVLIFSSFCISSAKD